MDDDPLVGQYIRDVRNLKLNLLSADEEQELAKRIQEGDLSARNRLVEANLPFVLKIAGKYSRYCKKFSLTDLIEEGNLGLIRAAEKFDPSLGRFLTYARFWIAVRVSNFVTNREEKMLNEDCHKKGDDEGIGILLGISSERDDIADFEKLEQFQYLAKKLLSNLRGRERKIVAMYFGLEDGEPHTLEEVGKTFGITKQRVKQIVSRALEDLHRVQIGA